MASVKCPHCGGTVTTGVSPWTVIGWIGVVLLVLFLGTCALMMKSVSDVAEQRASATPSPAPASVAPVMEPLRVHVVFECRRSAGGMAFVEGMVTNTGTRPIEYVELQVSFRGDGEIVVGRGDGYADSRPLAPGQSSTFKALGPDTTFRSCRVEQANSARGEAVELSM